MVLLYCLFFWLFIIVKEDVPGPMIWTLTSAWPASFVWTLNSALCLILTPLGWIPRPVAYTALALMAAPTVTPYGLFGIAVPLNETWIVCRPISIAVYSTSTTPSLLIGWIVGLTFSLWPWGSKMVTSTVPRPASAENKVQML